MTGGAEDDFERLLKFFYEKGAIIDVICPEGKRAAIYKNYASNLFCYSWGFLPVIPVSFVSYLKYIIKAIIQAKQIHKYTKNEKYDLCLLNVSVLLSPLVYCKLRKLKTVVYIRETIEPKILRKYVYKLLSMCGDYFFAVSNSIKNEFIKLTSDENIATIYSAIEEVDDYNTNSPESVLSGSFKDEYPVLVSKDKFKLLSIGGINERKNQRFVAEAINKLKLLGTEDLPVLFCAGKIDDKLSYVTDFKNYIKENNLQKNVLLLGETTKSQTFQIFKCCDVLVMSSLSEGMPLTMIEAFKFGVPVISTNVGGISEVLVDNHNGFFADSIEELVSAIIKLKEQPELVEKFVNNGKKSYLEHFNLSHNLNEIDKILDNLVSVPSNN